MARKKQFPTAWKRWIGKQAIILDTARMPVVVLITGVNKFGWLICRAINTDTTHFSGPLKVIDYSPNLYIKLRKQSDLIKARALLAQALSKFDKNESSTTSI